MSHAWIYMYWYLHVIFSCDVDIHIYITRIPFLLCIILNLFIWEPFRHFIISIMITNFYEHIFLLKWKLHTHFYDSRKQFNSILFFYFGGRGVLKNNTVAHVCLTEVKSLTRGQNISYIYILKNTVNLCFCNLIIFYVRWRDAGWMLFMT